MHSLAGYQHDLWCSNNARDVLCISTVQDVHERWTGHHRAGYLCARNALHVHGMRIMKDIVILETALIKWC